MKVSGKLDSTKIDLVDLERYFDMVSIRKWRHLGVQERYKILNQLTRLNEKKRAMEPKEVAEEISHQKCEASILETQREKNLAPAPEPSLCFSVCDKSGKDLSNAFQDHTHKLRKASRRKQSENQDPCLLRGVYFKNMKWQAAIKVDKKQIHLGTVASMEEAAHLYDRAAYLCGRVPNFDLSEEEKQELQGLQWEDFLQITKEAIANKKKQKRVENCVRRRRSSELLEGGRMDLSSFHLSQYLDTTASTHHHVVAPFYQMASNDEPSSVYQRTPIHDEAASILHQAATLVSFNSPHSSLYEQSAVVHSGIMVQPQGQTCEQTQQTAPFHSSESYFSSPLHQHSSAVAGNIPYP